MKYSAAAFAAVLLVEAGCAPKFDPQRQDAPGTFGERVVTLLCKRLAYAADRSDVRGDTYRETCDHGTPAPAGAPATVAAISIDRTRTAAAIDLVVPPDQTAALQRYLTSDGVLGMYDDGTMATTTQSLADMLAMIGSDPDAMAALARLGGHRGYRTPATAIGPNQALLSAPSIDSVLDSVLPAITPGGPAEAQWNAVTAAVGATFADASVPTEPVAIRISTLLRDLMLTERANLGDAVATPLVARDRRGVAIVALVQGAVPPPFVDADGDLLADVDAQGQFVDLAGMPLSVPAPFAIAGDSATRDPDGRAIDDLQAPIYAYRDLGKTVFGAISHDTAKLFDPAHGTIVDFARGASVLMGPRVAAQKTFDDGQVLAYQGYDTTQAPLLDLAYAFTTLLRDGNTDNVLALALQLFSPAHVATTARLAENAIATARLADAHAEAQIAPNAPLWDDLRPILQRIAAKPRLVSDILDAMKLPSTKLLADRFREEMEYADRFDIADGTQALVGDFTTRPDRAMADTGFNRSLFQRLLMVINDSQVSQCNKAGAVVKEPTTGLTLATYNACNLFKIDNLAVFYLQAIAYNKDATGNYICESNAGQFAATQVKPTPDACAAIGAGWRPQRKASFNYQWGAVVNTLLSTQGGDAFLESQSTIAGFRTHPTPEALNRVLFLPTTPQTIQDTSDPIVDKDGDLMKVQHAGTLPVWEKNNFYNEIRPLVQAFADAGEEQTFVDLMAVLHKHWSTPQSTTTQHGNPAGKNYTFGSSAVTYEPFIVDALQSDLWPALTETAPELTAITVNGKTFAAVLASSLAYVVTPQAALADRQGKKTSVTADGKPVAMLSPWQLLADAETAKRARLAAAGEAGQAWSDSAPELVDILYRGAKVGATWQFTNPRTAAVTLAITQFVRDRIAAHDAANDRLTWLATDLPNDMKAKLSHPVFAALIDLVDEFTTLGAPRLAIESLFHDVFDETAHPDAFAIMRVGNADLLQLATDDPDLVPLGHLIGAILAPGQTFLPTQLAFLEKLHEADALHTLRDVTARMFQPYDPTGDPGVPAISAIVDGVGDVDRATPGPEPAWSAGDYRLTFQSVAGFLSEQQFGLPRFIAIVKGRSL